jgi:hypothetical protein
MIGEISPCGRDDKEGAGMTKKEVVEVNKEGGCRGRQG